MPRIKTTPKRNNCRVSEFLTTNHHRSKKQFDFEHTTRVLPGGATLVQVAQPHLHRGTISVYFRSGSRFETPGDNGLSHFLEHMVYRGTEVHSSAYELNLAVERIGGSLYGATSADSTEFEMTLPEESLVDGAKLLAEVVTCPIFRDIEIERKIIAEEIREDLDEDDKPIDVDFLSRRRLWPGHPLGQAVTGPLENALKFSVEDIRRHMLRSYVASQAVICLTGSFDAASLVPVIEEEFSRLPGSASKPAMEPVVLGAGPTTDHAHRPGSQTVVRVSFHAPGGDDPDRIALAILLGIIDDGMSTRLHRRIFDELGLAYSVGADAELYADVGALSFEAVTSHGNVVEIVRQIGRLVDEIRSAPVSAEELEKAKKREIWGLESFLDSAHAMSSWYGEQALYWTPMPIAERSRRVEAVTPADITAVAARVFKPEHLHVTTVGVLQRTQREELERTVHEHY